MQNRNTKRLAVVCGAVGAVAGLYGPAVTSAAVVVKANNTNNLNLGSSWVNGVVPGSGDIAQFDSTYTINSALYLGADLSWSGINIVTPVNNIVIGSGNTLTLGANGITSDNTKQYTFNNAFTLSANQTWSDGNATAIGGAVNMAGYTLTLTSPAASTTTKFTKSLTGGGNLILSGATTYFSGTGTGSGTTGTTATSSNVTVTSGGALTFDNTTDVAAAARAASLTITGAGGSSGSTLNINGSSKANSTDSITNALTAGSGFDQIYVKPNSGYNATLTAGSFARNAGGVILFSGTNLGTNSLASQTAGAANISFITAPTLIGGSGTHTTDGGIIAGAFGDTANGGKGVADTTGGLVTYDSTNGVRLLKSTEYKNNVITDGQTQLDNVLLSNSSGTPATYTLNSNTTINSLSFNVSTALSSSINVTGSGTLKLNSGMIYANQSYSSSNSTDSMYVSVPTLDLNGQEGIIIAGESNISSTRTGGRLEISSVITNDGGNGLTFSGSTVGGVLALTGTSANTYTGVTTIDSGELVLGGGTGVTSIPGNVVINGGSLEDGSNHIADTSNITINGGAFRLQIGNEGSARNETFNNLVMNGGSYVTGASSHGGSSTMNGTATLAGGAMTLSSDQNVNVTGLTTLSGGTISIAASYQSSNSYNTNVALNGGLAITNIASGAYTPITVKAGSSGTYLGGELQLNGNLTFTGNATNANTTTIDAPAGSGTAQGVIALNGARTFNIGDGAAATDLAVVPDIIDGTSASSLNKTGAGSLALSGNNVYTGGTTVSAGTLIAANVTPGQSSTGTGSVTLNGGTLASLAGTTSYISGSVNAGSAAHSIAPGGTGAIGQLNVGGLSLNGNSTLSFDISGTSNDLLADSGVLTVTGTPTVSLTASGLSASSYTLASYTGSGLSNSSFNFSSTPSGYHWNVTNSALQLLQNASSSALALLTNTNPSATYSAMVGTANPGGVANSSTITLTGAGNGSYNPGYLNNISSNGNKGYVQINGFTPSDAVIAALSLTVNGAAPTSAQLAQLISDLNAGSSDVTAMSFADLQSSNLAAYNALKNNDPNFGTDPLEIALLNTGSYSSANPTYLALDFSGESSMGNVLVTDIAAIPEPATLALMGLVTAAGLIRRRRRTSEEK